MILSSAILLVVLLAGSLDITVIIESQRAIWFILPLFPILLIFFIGSVAETNRAPFDLAEAENFLFKGYSIKNSTNKSYINPKYISTYSPMLGKFYNKRTFSTTFKRSRRFYDSPSILGMIKDISTKEKELDNLWECDYSFITSAILPCYFDQTYTSWVITPEFNYLEGNQPDYTIFEINIHPSYRAEIHTVVELKSKKAASWLKLLEQMWDKADVAKSNDGKLWAIGQKGLEFCVFEFNVRKYEDQKPDNFTNFEPLNLSNLNTVQLDQLGVQYVQCNDNGFTRIALIKWRLDNPNHRPYIHEMLEHRSNARS